VNKPWIFPVVCFLAIQGLAMSEDLLARAEESSESSKQDASSQENVVPEAAPPPSSSGSDTGVPAAASPAGAPAAASTPSPSTSTPQASSISVDFKDADIRQVLRIISLKSGVDIVAGPDVEGLVTIKLTNVPWEQALEIILRTYGFAYERKGAVVRVMTKDAVDKEALANEVFSLSYAKAKEVTDVLKEMLSDRGKIKFDERTNTIVVTDLPSTIFQLKSVIERLDSSTPQVFIESKIIETKLTKDDNLGIDWFDNVQFTVTPASTATTFPFLQGTTFGGIGKAFMPRVGTFSPATGASMTQGRVPDNGGTFTFGTLGPAAMNVTLNMLKQRVNTNILSNPTITTLNNKEAFVQVGEDINIPNFQIDPSTGRATVTGFQTRSTGVILKVTPYVNAQKEIVLDVKPEITEVGSTFDTFASGISFPRFTVQKAQTQVRLNDGETLVIGGLVKRKRVETSNKVPVLGDIPLLGWLFTSQRDNTDPHQDLLIFLTVRLIEDAKTRQTTMAASTATAP